MFYALLSILGYYLLPINSVIESPFDILLLTALSHATVEMNPTNIPVPGSFAAQKELAFQAVTMGTLASVRVYPKRVAKPKKAAKTPAAAASGPAVASGRVTKKRGNRTARVETPVQTVPAVPQGTAVPPPPFGKFDVSEFRFAAPVSNK